MTDDPKLMTDQQLAETLRRDGLTYYTSNYVLAEMIARAFLVHMNRGEK